MPREIIDTDLGAVMVKTEDVAMISAPYQKKSFSRSRTIIVQGQKAYVLDTEENLLKLCEGDAKLVSALQGASAGTTDAAAARAVKKATGRKRRSAAK